MFTILGNHGRLSGFESTLLKHRSEPYDVRKVPRMQQWLAKN